jgi:hypothetical protein
MASVAAAMADSLATTATAKLPDLPVCSVVIRASSSAVLQARHPTHHIVESCDTELLHHCRPHGCLVKP